MTILNELRAQYPDVSFTRVDVRYNPRNEDATYQGYALDGYS